MGSYDLSILSMDNGMKINDIIVNRGNCPLLKYGGVDYDKASSYAQKHPENLKTASKEDVKVGFLEFEPKYVLTKSKNSVLYLYTKDGKSVKARTQVYQNDKETVAYLNGLSNEAREIYVHKLPAVVNFGERFDIGLGCPIKDILEIIIRTNKGDFEYE